MAGVVLENVSRVFPGQAAAVRAVSLEVRDREFLVLVGPSGCGKSTTLRLVAGLEELSSGTITIGTRIVNDVPPKDRDIAMVFQNYALYPHLSVYRNMAFGLELREGISGWSWLWRWALPPGRKRAMALRRYQVAEQVHAAARTLGIESLLERYPRQLSGGERQRVALGRAMVRSPAVFLFDEPLSNLDAKLRVEMRRELKELHRRLQTTMIYVTHDQVEALTLGQRIVVMNEGAIQQVGRPMELYDWPANRFVAGFIGTPGMNFVDGTLVSGSGNRQFRRGGLAVDLGARRLEGAPSGENLPAVLGVRPEDVRIGGRTISDRERPGSTVRGTVRLVESLGDATIVTVAIEERELVGIEKQSEFELLIKTDARSELRTGDSISVTVDVGRVHVFDLASGQNWVCPATVESKSATD